MKKGNGSKFYRHLAATLILCLCAANISLVTQPAHAFPLADGDLLAGNWESTYWVSSSAEEEYDVPGAPGTWPVGLSPDQLFDGTATADYDGTIAPTKHFVSHQKINLIFDFDPVRSPLGDSGVQISGLQMATADDENHDPTAWSLYGTNTLYPVDSDFTLITSQTGIASPGRNSDYQRTNFVAPSEKYRFFKFVVDEVAGDITSEFGGSALSSLRLFSPQGPGEFEPTDSSNFPLLATKSCSKIEANPPSNGAGFFTKMQATENITINEVALSMPLDVEAKVLGGEELFGGSVEIYLDENGIPAWQLPIAVFRTSSNKESLTSGQTVHYISIDGGFSIASGAYFWVKTLDPTCNTNYPIFAESSIEYNGSDSGISITRLNNDPAQFPVDQLEFVNDIFSPAIALFGSTPLNVGYRIATAVGTSQNQGYGTVDVSNTNLAAGDNTSINFSPENGSIISEIYLDGILLPTADPAYVDGKIDFFNVSRNHIVRVTFESLHPCSTAGNYLVDISGIASDNPNPDHKCSGDLTLDDSVTGIAQYGFGGNELITSVIFGNNVTTVSGAAFQAASNISSITLNDGLLEIGGYAFNGLPNLLSVTIPDTVTTIGQGAFMSSPLTSLVLGSSLLEIGYSAFAAEQLTDLVIPDSLTFLGSPFNGSQLLSLTVGGDGYNDEAPAFPNVDPTQLICFTNRVQGPNRSTWMINTTLANIPWCGTYTVSYSAGTNGSIVGQLTQIIDENTDGLSVTAQPSRSNYQFDSWSDGRTDNPRIDLAVTASFSVTANFSRIPDVLHTLTLNVGANGSSDPNISSSIIEGRNQLYVFTPDAGYELDHLYVDGEDFTSDLEFDYEYEDSMIFEIFNVVEDHSISVTFKPLGSNTVITPPIVNIAMIDGFATLAGGQTLLVEGYDFQAGATVSVAGSACIVTGRSSSFSVPNQRTSFVIECSMPAITAFGSLNLVVTNDDGGQVTWTVIATPANHAVTVVSGANGTISPGTLVSIAPGSARTYTFTPSTGYKLNTATLDGNNILGSLAVVSGEIRSYTFSSVTADHVIAATFISVLGAPTSVVANKVGKHGAIVTFNAPASNGGSLISSYVAVSNPGNISQTLMQSTSGTFTFDGLQPGTSYTFSVIAINSDGSSSPGVSNSIETDSVVVASLSALKFEDDGTGTGGKLVWTGKNIDAVLYTGLATAYPGPYNYGAFTSGWNGRIRNLDVDTFYTVSILAISADGVGESKTLTFRTSPGASSNHIDNISLSNLPEISQLGKLFEWIDQNVFTAGEASRVKRMLSKFDALPALNKKSDMKLPTSRVTQISAISETPAFCKVEKGLSVHALKKGKCVITYTVTSRSKAPASLTKEFNFPKV